MLKEEKIKEAANVFKILCDPTRLRIILYLINHKKAYRVSDIRKYLNVSQSAISHQLAKLQAWKIVKSYRSGRNMSYEILNNEISKKLKNLIKQFI